MKSGIVYKHPETCTTNFSPDLYCALLLLERRSRIEVLGIYWVIIPSHSGLYYYLSVLQRFTILFTGKQLDIITESCIIIKGSTCIPEMVG